MSDAPPEVAFAGVSLAYPGGVQALAEVSFRVEPGEICVLMGGSGSGKTSLLRLVNRMLTADRGEILLDGRPVTSWDPVALRRGIGYVIQEGGLFPHWTAERNVALVPRLLGHAPAAVEAAMTGAMALARIPRPEFGHRLPHQLSGGQRQRVALARAIAAGPRLLLLDEPFGALDPAIRAELQGELRTLASRIGCSAILVTHDIAEAFAVADRIVLLDRGRVVQVGTPAEIALAPNGPVAAAFTARQALELRLRHLRLLDVAPFLPSCAGSDGIDVPAGSTVADALAALASGGGERFAVVLDGVRLGLFERRAVWELLQRRAA